MDNIMEKILRGGKFNKLIESVLVHDAKERTGLNRIELVIIFLLYRFEELSTLTDICQYMHMNKGHISTTLDGLGKKGYIICQRDKNDRRFVRYQITEKANAFVLDMDNLWKEMSKRLIQGIDGKDLETFNRVASQIEDNIGRILNEYGEE